METERYNRLALASERYNDGRDLLHDVLLRSPVDASDRAIMLSVKRAVIDRARKAGRMVGDDGATAIERMAVPASQEAFVVARRCAARVAGLSSAHRDAIEGLAIGESVREAAERLGVPVGTILSRRHAARFMLAEEG